jgi:hypothetical protein
MRLRQAQQCWSAQSLISEVVRRVFCQDHPRARPRGEFCKLASPKRCKHASVAKRSQPSLPQILRQAQDSGVIQGARGYRWMKRDALSLDVSLGIRLAQGAGPDGSVTEALIRNAAET